VTAYTARLLAKRSELRKAWDIACASAGVTTGQVAASWGLAKVTLNGVLRGVIVSAPTRAKIAAFIEMHAPAREVTPDPRVVRVAAANARAIRRKAMVIPAEFTEILRG
jgi:hypothetical protein